MIIRILVYLWLVACAPKDASSFIFIIFGSHKDCIQNVKAMNCSPNKYLNKSILSVFYHRDSISRTINTVYHSSQNSKDSIPLLNGKWD